MTVLVTGSNGFIGSALVERLLTRKLDVCALVRPGSSVRRLDALRERNGHPFEIRRGHIASVDAAKEAIAGCDVIYHLAASMGGAPADMVLNTVVSSRNLLDAVTALETPPKVVLCGSFAIYGVASLPKGHVVNESTPLEPMPLDRDPYTQTKLWQEELFWQRRLDKPYPLVVVRPGVVYGPGGNAFSSRVGVQLPGLFLHLGGDNLIPLSYVENCAEALAVAGENNDAIGEVFNACDDDLPTARQYLRRYKREVAPKLSLTVPYPLMQVGSRIVEWYHHYSKGQLPKIFTPYKTSATWKGTGFDNSRIKSIGWRQLVSTDEGIRRAFESLAQAV